MDTIYIIDTDVTLIQQLRNGFQSEPNYKIIGENTNGQQGFSEIYKLRPSYAIINAPLWDVDYYKLVLAIKQHVPTTKIVVTLENNDDFIKNQLSSSGINMILPKPYTIPNLITLLTRNNNSINNALNDMSFNQNTVQFSNMPITSNNTINSINNMGNFDTTISQNTNNINNMNPLGNVMNTNSMDMEINNINPINNIRQNNTMNNNFAQTPMNNNISNPITPIAQKNFNTFKQKIISIYSPKGGVGKTTLSKEVASAFSKVSINGQPLKVLLIDLDLEFGDVCTMLRLQPRPNILNLKEDIDLKLKQFISGKENLPNYKEIRQCAYEQITYSQQELENFLIKTKSGLYVLAAPPDQAGHYLFDSNDMKVLLNSLNQSTFDLIIFDLGCNTFDWSLLALDKSQEIYMVVTLDVAALNDTKLLFDTFKNIQFDISKIKFIVNKKPTNNIDISPTDISKHFNVPIVAEIPDYAPIRTTNNSGTPVVLTTENEYTKSIINFANTISPVFNNKKVSNKKSNNKNNSNKKKGLFSKLFGK